MPKKELRRVVQGISVRGRSSGIGQPLVRSSGARDLELGVAVHAVPLFTSVAAKVGGGGDICVLPSSSAHLEVPVDLVEKW